MLSERLLNEYGPNHPKMRELRNKPQRGGPHGLDLHQAQRRLAVSQVLKKALNSDGQSPMVRDKDAMDEPCCQGRLSPTQRQAVLREPPMPPNWDLLKKALNSDGQSPMVSDKAWWQREVERQRRRRVPRENLLHKVIASRI